MSNEKNTVVSGQTFPEMVVDELSSARAGHAPINSLHEGYAVILEEMDELWEEVRKKQSQREPLEILAELVQIGAMAQRVAEDVLIVKRNRRDA
jgi:hypothetical protein